MHECPDYNATLIERVDITPRLAIMRVRPDSLDFAFTPGQYGTLALMRGAPRLADADPEDVAADAPDKLIKRAYSISSGSRTRDFIEFFVALVGSGELTPRLFALAIGDRLFLGPKPKGLFTLNLVPADKDVLMVATGTGLAPYVSMLRTHMAERPDQLITTTWSTCRWCRVLTGIGPAGAAGYPAGSTAPSCPRPAGST